jgi:hypothetical protein
MLEKWAADEFRSLNGQIEWILHGALKEAGRSRSPGADRKQSGSTKGSGDGPEPLNDGTKQPK